MYLTSIRWTPLSSQAASPSHGRSLKRCNSCMSACVCVSMRGPHLYEMDSPEGSRRLAQPRPELEEMELGLQDPLEAPDVGDVEEEVHLVRAVCKYRERYINGVRNAGKVRLTWSETGQWAKLAWNEAQGRSCWCGVSQCVCHIRSEREREKKEREERER